MSNLERATPSPLVVPADSDEQFIRRQEYEDPIRKASIWLHKLIIHRIRDVQAIAPWYRGESWREVPDTPRQFISDLLSQEDGRFCRRFAYYCRMIKKYKQSNVPRQIIDDDCRAVTILIRLLAELVDDTETLRLVKRRIGEFAELVTAREGGRLLREDYFSKLDNLADSIITLFGRVSDQFKRLEQIRLGERSEPVTKADIAAVHKTAAKTERKVDIVLAKQEETRQTVVRLDKRDRKAKKNARQRFSVETQELVFGYWERGQQNQQLKKEAGKHRVTHDLVFAYYKDELRSLGIKTLAAFTNCLRTRSDRLAYARRSNRKR